MHADVGKVPWNKYSLAARERAVEFSTNNHVNNNVGQPMPAAPHETFNSAHTYLLTSSCMFYSL